jgi:hypothetical protein
MIVDSQKNEQRTFKEIPSALSGEGLWRALTSQRFELRTGCSVETGAKSLHSKLRPENFAPHGADLH